MKNVNIYQNEKKNTDLVLYYLLHKNPIYKYVKGQEDIHIMILGTGEWAMRFIGIALQTCQVVGREVTITVVADDIETAKKAKEKYVKTRPAVETFVNVRLVDEKEELGKGSLDGKGKEIYGTLNFVNRTFININETKTDLFKKYGKPQYLFIDLKQKEKTGRKKNWNKKCNTNRSGLRTVMEAFSFQNDNYRSINYVVTAQNSSVEVLKGGNPVFVNVPIPEEELEPLEQMAFNAHLSWYNTLNIDQVKEREIFKENIYNYNSSLAFVLSIPYKLWSVGIQYTNNYVASAAAKFQEKLDSNKPGQPCAEYLKLIQLEHRRWVLEKICDNDKGWRAPNKNEDGRFDYSYCIADCCVKDNVKKIHPCIVRSTEDMPLKKNTMYTEEPRQGWNKQNNDNDERLDELDRMSVELHRVFYKEAQDRIEKRPLENEDGDVCKLERILFGEANDVLRAFNRYRYCIKNILAGNKAYSKQFDSVQREFEKALVAVPWEKRLKIIGNKESKTIGLLKNINNMLFPVIESNLYRDYKSLDEELVKNIPFILTYKQIKELVLAFDDGLKEYGRRNNNAVFQNVASATVLNPKCITYLYYSDNSDENTFVSKFTTVLEYLFKRIEGCEVYLAIALRNRPDKSWDKEKVDDFIDIINKRVAYIRELTNKNGKEEKLQFGIKKIICQNEQEAIGFFEKLLSDTEGAVYDETTEIFDTKEWNREFDYKMKRIVPYFEFSNFKNKHFSDCKTCEQLKYIERGTVINKTCLRIEDMFALMNAKNTTYDLPDFADEYILLWDIYKGDLLEEDNNKWSNGVTNWTRLCDQLKKYFEVVKVKQGDFDYDKIEIVKLIERKTIIEKEFPLEFYNVFTAFCETLYNLKILEKKPFIKGNVIRIISKYDLKKLFNELLKNPKYYFKDGKWLSAKREYRPNDEILIIKYNNLKVVEMEFDLNIKDNQLSKRILDELNKPEVGFIKDLKYKNSTVSFTFTSEKNKKLLSTAGEILELYTYYEALKTGYFDDIACSYIFQWELGGVTNELDCVLTKGFRTIIVECKAVSKLDQTFYQKLDSLSNQFGIAEKGVILANTYDHRWFIEKKNNLNIMRGKQMDIITISKPEDILHIGQKLCEIMEGIKGEKENV